MPRKRYAHTRQGGSKVNRVDGGVSDVIVEHTLGRTAERRGKIHPACDDCGHPVRASGLTLSVRRQRGKQCPKCLRFETPKMSPEAMAAHKERVAKKIGMKGTGDPRSDERRLKAAVGRVSTQKQEGESSVMGLLRQKAEERAEQIIAPFFSALELEADPNWKASTKLRFYLDQMNASTAVLNRIDGLPVARQRQVDKDGMDLTMPDLIPDHVPPGTIDAFLMSAIDRLISDRDLVHGMDGRAFDVGDLPETITADWEFAEDEHTPTQTEGSDNGGG